MLIDPSSPDLADVLPFPRDVAAFVETNCRTLGIEPTTRLPLQACAVPFRWATKTVEFCLITTSRGNWNFPKGMIDPGETHEEAALKEAFEEAGLHGRLQGDPLGSYRLAKCGKTFHVIASLMQVSRCDQRWQEERSRQRKWVTADEAGQLITQEPVRQLLEQAQRRLGG